MESEIELDDHIKDLHVLATAPHLYNVLVSLGVVESLLGVLVHENTDISISTLHLLNAMTDPDVLVEDVDSSKRFIDALVSDEICLCIIHTPIYIHLPLTYLHIFCSYRTKH